MTFPWPFIIFSNSTTFPGLLSNFCFSRSAGNTEHIRALRYHTTVKRSVVLRKPFFKRSETKFTTLNLTRPGVGKYFFWLAELSYWTKMLTTTLYIFGQTSKMLNNHDYIKIAVNMCNNLICNCNNLNLDAHPVQTNTMVSGSLNYCNLIVHSVNLYRADILA